MKIEDIDYIHDVVCPICETKATYKITGKGFVSQTCGHKEVENLIEQREDEIIEKLKPAPQKTVRLHQIHK